MPMNPKVKKKWLKELRDRKNVWLQGREQLCSVNEKGEDQICCLAVLTDIGIREGVCDPWTLQKPQFFGSAHWGVNGVENILPDKIVEWAGLEHGDPSILGRSLSVYNDGSPSGDVKPRNFSEIADLIEKYL